MTTVTLPRSDIAAVLPASNGDLLPSRDLYRWMRDITDRVGGVSGSGTADLAVTAFEDAGIEETKSVVADARAEFAQWPVTPAAPIDEYQGVDVNLMWAVIQALATRVEALEQGLSA